ncbi:hypothetical protein QK870_sRNA5gp1 [Japanese star anise ringspot-associated virus]|uniref:Uncharacterized protein n=1 Tax=Japanese star anise ringspot-associated virus TaxID=2798807 RepID=A0A8J9R3F2_9VIRU|nr:hypothetical protein QK870_sRNA5gp1 [Japanese star anise ringspot-associated virus]BCO17112.1 hypothetical protein [Japanese star anise ringspot-associated virus]
MLVRILFYQTFINIVLSFDTAIDMSLFNSLDTFFKNIKDIETNDNKIEKPEYSFVNDYGSFYNNVDHARIQDYNSKHEDERKEFKICEESKLFGSIFRKVKTPGIERTHQTTYVYENTVSVELEIPEIPYGSFSYIQFWAVSHKNPAMTSEIGIGKQKETNIWKPLIFNTNDGHNTGYSSNNYMSWPYNPDRTVVFSNPEFYANDKIKLTCRVDEQFLQLWVNGDLVGMVSNTGLGSFYFKFGFEYLYSEDYPMINISSFIKFQS